MYKRTDAAGLQLCAGFKQTYCQTVNIEIYGRLVRPDHQYQSKILLISTQGDSGKRWRDLREDSAVHKLQ